MRILLPVLLNRRYLVQYPKLLSQVLEYFLCLKELKAIPILLAVSFESNLEIRSPRIITSNRYFKVTIVLVSFFISKPIPAF